MLSRRLFLLSSPTLAAVLPHGVCVGAGSGVPGVQVPGVRVSGTEVTELKAGTDGFNGIVPGPVIRAPRGATVAVRLVNGLDEPVALCWHGVRGANAIDGGGTPLAPGAAATVRVTAPDAGTFFYRATPRPRQRAGLYGALVVAEPGPPAVDQDLVLVLDSRPDDRGAHWTVNGAGACDIAVRANERLRLRFVNASAIHAFEVRLADHRVLVMALDGEPAEPFASRDGAVSLAPGNRADVFVDTTLAPGSVAQLSFMASGGGAPPALRLVYGASSARAAPQAPPPSLPGNPLPDRINLASAVRATLALGATTPPPDRRPAANAPLMLFTAERGRTVVLTLENRDALGHVVYVDGHHFRRLDRLDDGWKPYWLDTVAVAPRETVRVAFVAGTPGRFRLESGAIAEAAAVVENWFEVR